MNALRPHKTLLWRIFASLCWLSALPTQADTDATQLLQRYELVRAQIENSALGLPMHQQSSQVENRMAGEVWGIIDAGYPVVMEALTQPEAWCDIALLHQNIKTCRVETTTTPPIVWVRGGKKLTPLSEADHTLGYQFTSLKRDKNYLQLRLWAAQGPLGTRDYELLLEAAPLTAQRTILRFMYGYTNGWQATMALKLYLATAGRDKVGFTVVGNNPDGTPIYITGERAIIERNTVRYFLGIHTYLAALSLPPAQRFEWRLNTWFDLAARFRRQLHEMEKSEYLATKRAGNATP